MPISTAVRQTASFSSCSSAGQPAGREHYLVATLQLHRCADRLPAARRTARLDGRRAGLCGDRMLPARKPRHPSQVCARHDRGPAGRWRHRACRARPDAQSRGHHPRLLWLDRLGRCDLRDPARAPRSLWRRRNRPRGAAGDGEVERFLWSISNGPIVRPPKEWGARGFTFGDWLQPRRQWPREKPFRTIGDDAVGDDLSVHLLKPHGAGREDRRRQGASRSG